MRTLATVLFAALLLAPAGAAAAPSPVPDRVLAEETAPMDVGVDGSVVAWTRRVGTRGVEVAIRAGDARTRVIPAGRGTSPVDVGRERSGRRVVVFARCGGRCDLLALPAVGGRSRVLAARTRVDDVAVGGGRVFWFAGDDVRSRALAGGPARREAVVAALTPLELETDGTTLAVTGDLAGDDTGNGTTGLSVTRVGSGRARLRGSRTFGEEYAALRSPAVTSRGVSTLFDEQAMGVSLKMRDFAAGRAGSTDRGTGGTGLLQWDVAGRRTAYIEAPSSLGCALGDEFSEVYVGRAPCRIVVAATDGERLLPPRVAVGQGQATVLRTRLLGARVTGREPVAGVRVELRRRGRVVGRRVTDDAGRIALPDTGGGGLVVVAATAPPSYGYTDPFD